MRAARPCRALTAARPAAVGRVSLERSGRAPSDARLWDGHAGRYGAQEWLQERAIATAIRLAEPGVQDDVVDLATGSGVIPRALARHRTPPASLVGIDRSRGMLALVGPLPEGWSTLLADARDVPLPAASADLVTCAYLLHLLTPEERLAVLREAHRLLRPGPRSRLVVVTVWTDRRRPGGRALGSGLTATARRFPERLGGLAPLDPTADLRCAGFQWRTRAQLPHGGYPSLVIRASRTA